MWASQVQLTVFVDRLPPANGGGLKGKVVRGGEGKGGEERGR